MEPSAKNYYWLGLALVFGTAILLVLLSGALGIIGAGDADTVYLGVLAVGVLGAVVARFRAAGLALTALAMAVAQVVAPVAAFAAGLSGTEEASVVDVVGLTAGFAALFAASAWLFRRALALRA